MTRDAICTSTQDRALQYAECDLTSLDAPTLARCIEQERNNYAQGLLSDTRYGYELFRRALATRDDDAWHYVYALYAPLITRWIQRCGAFSISGESCDWLVNATFERLSKTVSPQRFAQFTSLASLLNYLQRCARCAVIDCARAQPWGTMLPEEMLVSKTSASAPEDEALDRVQQRELWALVNTMLHNDAERLLMMCSFVLGMKPGSIAERHPGVFADVQAVYTMKRNIIDRLSRNMYLRTLLSA